MLFRQRRPLNLKEALNSSRVATQAHAQTGMNTDTDDTHTHKHEKKGEEGCSKKKGGSSATRTL